MINGEMVKNNEQIKIENLLMNLMKKLSKIVLFEEFF